MAGKREYDGQNELPQRESPYEQFEPQDDLYEDDFAEDRDDGVEYENDGEYEDEYAGGGLSGFLSTAQGKAMIAAIALLLAILIGVVIWRVAFYKPQGEDSQPQGTIEIDLPTQEPGNSLVFAPETTAAPEVTEAPAVTDAPIAPVAEQTPVTSQPPVNDADQAGAASGQGNTTLVFSPISGVDTATGEPEQTPTAEPEPTETPLPIVMTNTPTPSPTAAPTATPSPTPEPTATPTPSPTPRVDIGTGKTNRDARLRASMSATGSVKRTVDKGEALTIHEAARDAEGKLWYAVTVDDIATDGWMRDYVVNLDGELDATPAPADEGASATPTAAPTATPEGVIGTGKTNRDPTNVRRIMNGEVIVQLRKNKPVRILEVRQDKNGDTWYRISTENGTTGFVRDYVITLDSGVTLPGASSAPTSTPSATGATGATSPTPSPEAAEQTPSPTPTISPEEELLQREPIGQAVTNREANVRERPDGKVLRQLSRNFALRLLEKYDVDGKIWYEVVTNSGKTHGFVRDYVIEITEIDVDLPAKTYEP